MSNKNKQHIGNKKNLSIKKNSRHNYIRTYIKNVITYIYTHTHIHMCVCMCV